MKKIDEGCKLSRIEHDRAYVILTLACDRHSQGRRFVREEMEQALIDEGFATPENAEDLQSWALLGLRKVLGDDVITYERRTQTYGLSDGPLAAMIWLEHLLDENERRSENIVTYLTYARTKYPDNDKLNNSDVNMLINTQTFARELSSRLVSGLAEGIATEAVEAVKESA
jgi:hypothetical protein